MKNLKDKIYQQVYDSVYNKVKTQMVTHVMGKASGAFCWSAKMIILIHIRGALDNEKS